MDSVEVIFPLIRNVQPCGTKTKSKTRSTRPERLEQLHPFDLARKLLSAALLYTKTFSVETQMKAVYSSMYVHVHQLDHVFSGDANPHLEGCTIKRQFTYMLAPINTKSGSINHNYNAE